MPFTAGHPSAVVPLDRTPAVTSALVLGSLAPDVPYYLPVPIDGDATHSTLGTLVYDVPAALLLLVAFHVFLKWPLVALAPSSWQPALVGPAGGFSCRSLRQAALVVGSAAAGAATHVLWDAFTHVDGQVVEVWPALESELLGAVPTYRLLQHLSSVVGVTIVIWWARRSLQHQARLPVPDAVRLPARARAAALAALGGGAVLGALVGLAVWDPGDLTGYDLTRGYTVQALFGAGTGLTAALVLYSAGWRWARRA